MQIRPLGKNVLFQFLDETVGSKGRFIDRQTASGIIVPSTVNRQKVHRWGKVVAVGPEVLDLKAGNFILIEALMWTFGAKINEEEKIWKTDESKVLVVTDDEAECYPQ